VIDTVLNKNVRQMSMSPTSWTRITYQSLPTCWIMLGIGMISVDLKIHRVGAISTPCLWINLPKNPNWLWLEGRQSTSLLHKLSGLLHNSSWNGIDQGYQPLFMVV